MVEPLEAAAEACFTDELLLLDFPSAADPPAPAAAGGGKQQHQYLLDIFDPADESIPGLEAGGGEAEEELEWLLNKDAFPGLETSFEVPDGRRTSPVSVLSAAAPPQRVPVRARSKGRRRGRRVLPLFPPPPGREKRRCRHCEAEETPQWRTGPEGPKTLCNACGVRYKSGRLVPEYRPASSPTFSAFVHSNSHRRILEMRRLRGASPRGRRSARVPPLATGRAL